MLEMIIAFVIVISIVVAYELYAINKREKTIDKLKKAHKLDLASLKTFFLTENKDLKAFTKWLSRDVKELILPIEEDNQLVMSPLFGEGHIVSKNFDPYNGVINVRVLFKNDKVCKFTRYAESKPFYYYGKETNQSSCRMGTLYIKK